MKVNFYHSKYDFNRYYLYFVPVNSIGIAKKFIREVPFILSYPIKKLDHYACANKLV